MADIFVRTTWASDLNHRARAVLRSLADVDQAEVSGSESGPTDAGAFNVHSQTALSLIRKGYAEAVDDDHICITREGMIKVGKIAIPRAERKRRKEAESLEAQASGKWKPAPAGASRDAERADRDAREELAEASRDVAYAKEALNQEYDLLRLIRRWGDDGGEEAQALADIERQKARLADVEAQLAALKQRRAA